MITREENKFSISTLKQTLNLYKLSDDPSKKFLYYAIRILSSPFRFLFDPDYRAFVLLKYTNTQEAHQLSNYTKFDRYPDLFTKCKKIMESKENLQILSFGCSTGEEVFTLRKYFPNAYITGVDINKRNIKRAISKNRDSQIFFSDDIKKTLAKNGPFDIVFALAVFQRSENRKEKTIDSSNIYPFEKFNTKINELNSHINSKGLFVIDHADYFFEDTDIASQYYFLEGEHNIIRDRYMFRKNNQRIEKYVMHHRIFIKK